MPPAWEGLVHTSISSHTDSISAQSSFVTTFNPDMVKREDSRSLFEKSKKSSCTTSSSKGKSDVLLKQNDSLRSVRQCQKLSVSSILCNASADIGADSAG